MTALATEVRGSALVLVAIVLAVLAGVIGLAIDLNIALSSSTEQQQLSNVLASGALKAYLESVEDAAGNPLSFSDRMTIAVSRAEEIAGRPENKPFYEGLLSTSSASATLCLSDGVSQHCNAGTDIGALIPGTWIYELPPDNSNPCSDNYPCLRQSHTLETVNAFQVELRQSSAAPLRTIFLRLLGFESLRTSALSTVAVVPRQLAIVVDLSGSIVGQTHGQASEANAGFRQRAAYKLAENFNCGDVSTNPAFCPSEEICPGIVHSDDPGSADRNLHKYWHRTVVELGSRPEGAFDPTVHYADEYECFIVENDGDEDGSNNPSHYLVDTYQNPTQGYYGPEPMTSIFRAIHESLDVMKDTAQPGDGVIFLGFDRTTLSRRVIPSVADSGPRLFSLASISDADADFRLLMAVTDVENQNLPYEGDPLRTNLQVRIEDHALFPRVNPFESNQPRSGLWTNLKNGVYQGYQALRDNSSVDYADRELVVFSDFLSNCTTAEYNDDPERCLSTEPEPPNGCCANDQMHILSGRATWWMGAWLPRYRIHFNPIIFGNYVAPHTVLLYDGHGGCLLGEEDEEIIRSQPGWPTSYINPDGGLCPPDSNQPCYLPADYFYNARDTGGVWGVIRPCCAVDDTCTDVRPQLEAACDARPLNTPIYRPVNATGLTDSVGRILCDPQGRTPLQQMRDYMLKVMGTNPIRFVGPSERISH